MDNIILRRSWISGSTVKVDSLAGQTFTGESEAHTFEIAGVSSSGASVPITGTITGRFLSSDNLTHTLTGSIANGVATVTLTEECYLVPGRFVVSIYADDGNDQTICIYCGVGNVFRTASDSVAYPSATIPDLEDLLQDVQAAIESCPASHSAIQAAIAPDFAQAAANPAKTYVWNGGVCYYLENGHTAGTAWADTTKTTATIGNDIADLVGEVADLKSALSEISTATDEDEGKALIAKTVDNGKVVEWEFGEAGGSGVVDPTLTNAGEAADAKAAGDLIQVGGNQPTAPANKIWFPEEGAEPVIIPTMNDISMLADVDFSTFKKIGVCGDSLASGCCVHNDGNPSAHIYTDFYEYSWIQCIGRKTGIQAINFSKGGLTTRTWLTNSEYGLAKLQNPDNKCDCYFLALGQNDKNSGLSNLGTISDVNSSDPIQSQDTFYGNYAKIIGYIKQVQPKAIIFCLTIPNPTNDSTIAAFDDAIRAVSTLLNTFVLELTTDDYNSTSSNRRYGHYNAWGYNQWSAIILDHANKYMRDHPSLFKQIEFIGTNYSWG